MAESEIKVKVENGPIQHDGWRSRRFVAGCAAFVLILGAGVALLLVSGMRPAADQFFSQEYALYFAIAAIVTLVTCMGLLSLDKLLEVVKLFIPVLRAKFGLAQPKKPLA